MAISRPIPLEHVGDPVRRRVVSHLEAAGPSTVDDLAEAIGVHPNTVRMHVAALEGRRLVEREPLASGTRGRPRLRYRLADGWRAPGPDYKGLADLFAQSLAALDPAPDRIAALGREWGAVLAGDAPASDPAELIAPAMQALGFDVSVAGDVVTLSGCPCRLVLPDRPELVCRLAAAVVEGLASAAGRPVRVASATHDPQTRRCELRLTIESQVIQPA